jgi:hypothetical protein
MLGVCEEPVISALATFVRFSADLAEFTEMEESYPKRGRRSKQPCLTIIMVPRNKKATDQFLLAHSFHLSFSQTCLIVESCTY